MLQKQILEEKCMWNSKGMSELQVDFHDIKGTALSECGPNVSLSWDLTGLLMQWTTLILSELK